MDASLVVATGTISARIASALRVDSPSGGPELFDQLGNVLAKSTLAPHFAASLSRVPVNSDWAIPNLAGNGT